jgi:hypothetical protein
MSEELYRFAIELAAIEELERYDFQPIVADDKIVQRLASARRAAELTLVLGAGISTPSGLQGWEQLVRSAAARTLAGTAVPVGILDVFSNLKMSPTLQVRFFETVSRTKLGFRSHLTEALYEGYRTIQIKRWTR